MLLVSATYIVRVKKRLRVQVCVRHDVLAIKLEQDRHHHYHHHHVSVMCEIPARTASVFRMMCVVSADLLHRHRYRRRGFGRCCYSLVCFLTHCFVGQAHHGARHHALYT